MAIEVRRKKREIRDQGIVVAEFTGADVGKSIDFMGIPDGFRIVGVNLTVDEVFANADNKISVGLESDMTRFMGENLVNALAGFGGNNKQYTASQSTPIVANIVGTASATGKATVTVTYAKLPVSRQEY